MSENEHNIFAKRALYLCKRVYLHTRVCRRALCLHKRALYLCKKDLYLRKKALYLPRVCSAPHFTAGKGYDEYTSCVAVCCSVLQYLLQCVAVCCSICSSVLQCVAVSVAVCCSICCSVLQYLLQCVAVCCSVLQYLLQCVAVSPFMQASFVDVCRALLQRQRAFFAETQGDFVEINISKRALYVRKRTQYLRKNSPILLPKEPYVSAKEYVSIKECQRVLSLKKRAIICAFLLWIFTVLFCRL